MTKWFHRPREEGERLDLKFWRALGPGVLFAGAAIGTSHLVQSTRAGALFGLGFLGIIIFANLIKYPAFSFGPAYTAATGESLINGYARIGKWVVAVVSLGLLLVQAIIIAATAITTAGIAASVLGLEANAQYLGVGLIALSILIVRIGGYGVLDNLTKVFIATLTLCTIAATIMAIPSVDWVFTVEPFHSADPAVFIFAVAVMGFMPSAVDLSILHSLWAVEKRKSAEFDTERSSLDFNIGYIGTAFLAICFLIMGTGVLHSSGTEPASSAPAFAGQVISLYTTSLGGWSGVIVGVSALAVMFTTLLAIIDGAPRMQSACLKIFVTSDEELPHQTSITIVLSVMGSLVLLFAMSSFTTFIDFVTTTSFIVGPVIALFNHLAITSDAVPLNQRPTQVMLVWSWIGIAAMSIVTLLYFYYQLVG